MRVMKEKIRCGKEEWELQRGLGILEDKNRINREEVIIKINMRRKFFRIDRMDIL